MSIDLILAREITRRRCCCPLTSPTTWIRNCMRHCCCCIYIWTYIFNWQYIVCHDDGGDLALIQVWIVYIIHAWKDVTNRQNYTPPPPPPLREQPRASNIYSRSDSAHDIIQHACSREFKYVYNQKVIYICDNLFHVHIYIVCMRVYVYYWYLYGIIHELHVVGNIAISKFSFHIRIPIYIYTIIAVSWHISYNSMPSTEFSFFSLALCDAHIPFFFCFNPGPTPLDIYLSLSLVHRCLYFFSLSLESRLANKFFRESLSFHPPIMAHPDWCCYYTHRIFFSVSLHVTDLRVL